MIARVLELRKGRFTAIIEVSDEDLSELKNKRSVEEVFGKGLVKLVPKGTFEEHTKSGVLKYIPKKYCNPKTGKYYEI